MKLEIQEKLFTQKFGKAHILYRSMVEELPNITRKENLQLHIYWNISINMMKLLLYNVN